MSSQGSSVQVVLFSYHVMGGTLVLPQMEAISWALTSKRGGHEGLTISQSASLGRGCLLCKLGQEM